MKNIGKLEYESGSMFIYSLQNESGLYFSYNKNVDRYECFGLNRSNL